MIIKFDSFDLENVDKQGFPLVIHNEERREHWNEGLELIGMLKEGCLGVIDWNTFIVSDESTGEQYNVDFALNAIHAA